MAGIVQGVKSVAKAVVPSSVRSEIRYWKGVGGFFLPALVRNPTFAFTALRGANRLRRSFREIRADQQSGRDTYLKPWHPTPLPRVIWMYWHQGEANAPELVQAAIASWKDRNPDWTVRVLTAETLQDWIDISDLSPNLSIVHASDIYRLRLLNAHGGLWTDATVWCHRALDDWLPTLTMSGPFFFAHPPGNDRMIEPWFIASRPNSPLLQGWEGELSNWARAGQSGYPVYFWTNYCMEYALKASDDARNEWQRAGLLPAAPSEFVWSAVHGRTDPAVALAAVQGGFPVSKLSHKSDKSFAVIRAALSAAEAGGPSAP